MTFQADNLPAGLQLDAKAGIITGVNPPRGEYVVVFHAENELGKSEKKFKIVSGDTLALTPPMGWNDWYAYYNRITDRTCARRPTCMVTSGMADAGYQYVNIDDCWMNAPKRPARIRCASARSAMNKGNILPNKHFPDMKALTDYIHAKGLKAGIYTSPGPLTCAGFTGAISTKSKTPGNSPTGVLIC